MHKCTHAYVHKHTHIGLYACAHMDMFASRCQVTEPKFVVHAFATAAAAGRGGAENSPFGEQVDIRASLELLYIYMYIHDCTIRYYTIRYDTITILYHTIPYHTIPYYTILYYTILYYTILYYTILYYTILYYTILYYTISYQILLYHHILHHIIKPLLSSPSWSGSQDALEEVSSVGCREAFNGDYMAVSENWGSISWVSLYYKIPTILESVLGSLIFGHSLVEELG